MSEGSIAPPGIVMEGICFDKIYVFCDKFYIYIDKYVFIIVKIKYVNLDKINNKINFITKLYIFYNI